MASKPRVHSPAFKSGSNPATSSSAAVKMAGPPNHQGANTMDLQIHKAYMYIRIWCMGQTLLVGRTSPAYGKPTENGRQRRIGFYTVDLNPTREQMEAWLKSNVEDPLGVTIIHLKMLERKHFMVVLRSAAEKAKVMKNIPYNYNRRQVVVLQWGRGYNPAQVKKALAPVWVNIQNPYYIFEDLAMELLESIGPLSYLSGVDPAGSRFPHIRGLVLLDLRRPLPSCIEVEWMGESKALNLIYENLPDCCLNCGSRGHLIRACPIEVNEEAERKSQAPMIATDEEGFQVVNRRRTRRQPPSKPPTSSNNHAGRPDRSNPNSKGKGGAGSQPAGAAQVGETPQQAGQHNNEEDPKSPHQLENPTRIWRKAHPKR
ncbi:hypothetical protein R1sor_014510 [Riccia sorocarpa]|uniref:CCHC-type domain-containing protein n=1 Tax=Riccia sorocarpa TaxID=122646 RepID=A0ABD3HBH4_9MARC